ncbi:TIGR02757 family protein [Pedobacter psychroterrae]|uniref:TIGR02757 family protein n=1 Tax=Pedobacter psychroterrae TaxID=2530453 RepID=A0A4R0NLG8_9SPHI|nr:TIGR02757 family protein [Pedobacter psychroterrae]TCD01476.1 TIGR02757 family protein [Pedobacter psychroterrae]
MEFLELKDFLDVKVALYNRPDFIQNDPVCIPHQFSKKQDIEIAAFFAAILAWGQRKTIINKCNELFARMDHEPYEFMMHHGDEDLKRLLGFKHRTFNDTDLLYFVSFFKSHYQQFDSLEAAFLPPGDVFQTDFLSEQVLGNYQSGSYASSSCMLTELNKQTPKIERALNYFRAYFFSLPEYPGRTIKHVSSPLQKSTCKRLNMFLRWMVRSDDKGVDFGIWKTIKPADLICPCDVHVDRVARRLGLIERKQTDWRTAVELTDRLLELDPLDPVKYDFALFGLGVEEKF